MRTRRVLATDDVFDVFTQAVRERALAVLTVQCAEAWYTCKARFLERDQERRFFVLDYQTLENPNTPPLVVGQYVGVSFRQKSRKVLFPTVVEARGHYVLDDKTSIPAVRFRWPTALTELQRRAYYRTPVPHDVTLAASIWRGGVNARATSQQQPLGVLTGEVDNLSCGGAFLRLHGGSMPQWADDEVVGVQISLPDTKPALVADCRFRGARPEPLGGIGVAVQFLGLEMSVDGRLTLQRLARCVQRFHQRSIVAGSNNLGIPHEQ